MNFEDLVTLSFERERLSSWMVLSYQQYFGLHCKHVSDSGCAENCCCFHCIAGMKKRNYQGENMKRGEHQSLAE